MTLFNLLTGLGGILMLIGIAGFLSSNKKAINYKTVSLGVLVHISIAFLALKWDTGNEILKVMSQGVQNIMDYANQGISFMFGSTLPDNGIVFAFQVLPVIIFVSALFSALYYLGVMQKVVSVLGGLISKIMGTSKVESTSAVANIFMGCTEAPLVVKPYLKKVTKSELFTIMTGGFASVAGSVLVGYSLLGIPLEYLIVASFMTAPASLVMAKIMMPETKKGTNDVAVDTKSGYANIIDAISDGAGQGMKLVLNIGAMLIAFISIIALLNGVLGGVGSWFGFDLTLQMILGYLFAPLAYIIGVPTDEILLVGRLIGEKTVINEFVGFMSLAEVIGGMSEKAQIIATFALCGFANLSVIAIQIGGIGGLEPSRKKHVADLGMKALIAGILANLLSATVAGMML